MQLRHWLATGISLGFLFGAMAQGAPAPAQDAPAAAAAPVALPQPCVDAGAKTEAECAAFLAKEKEAAAKAAADKAAADKAAAEKAAADNAAAEKAAQEKAAADKAAAEKAAADKAAAEKAAAAKAAAEQAAAAKAAAEKAAAEKPAAAPAAPAAPAAEQPAAAAPAANDQNTGHQRQRLAKDCVAAGLKTAADCDALHAINTQKAGEKPAAPAAPAEPAAAPASSTPAAPAAEQPAATDQNATPPAATDQNPRHQRQRLSKDCIAAGLKTAADCDALHAINTQKAGEKPAAAAPAAPAEPAAAPAPAAPAAPAEPATAPAPAAPAPAASAPAASAPAASAPAAPAAGAAPAAPATLPAEVTPAKPEGRHKPAAEPAAAAPALPDIHSDLAAAAKSYNDAVAGLVKAGGDQGAGDQARAGMKSARDQMAALCKTNNFDTVAHCVAQYGIVLAQPPAAAAAAGDAVGAPVQPTEVITTLPKGVTKQEVAPLLDSAKDEKTGKGQGPAKPGEAVPPAAGQAAAAPAVSNAPPPSNDKAAQVDIKPAQITPIDQTKGQQIDPKAANAPQVGLPQNVTIVNQTVVNNTTTTTTNNTTNVTNTQNNNGAGAQQNGAPGNGPGNGQPPGRHGPRNAPGAPPNGEPNPIGLGLQVILQLGNQLIINSPAQDQQRIAGRGDHTGYERLPGDRYRETIERPEGVRIVTVYNRNGDILRRSRFDRDGHETVLAYFDDRHDQDLLNWRDPGQDLPPLQLHIPARDYVLDADEADTGQVQQFFAQPPVERVQRLYSIDEVKRSSRIRDMVRRLEIGDLTFDSGAATISEDQVANLSKVAQAMLDLLQNNPAETFLIEGHTDAVGSDISNLRLSDARAATVAKILTDFYRIPPENLATQGYGEQFLKINTQAPEPLNRRVVIRRITPLVTVATQGN